MTVSSEIILPQRVRDRLGYDVHMDTKCFDAKMRDGSVVKRILVIGGAAMFGTVAHPTRPPSIDPDDIIAIRNRGTPGLGGLFKRWVPVV